MKFASVLTLFVAFFITACQTPGRVVKTEPHPDCPKCKIQTRTSPIDGVTYTKIVCPDCRKVVEDQKIREGGGPYDVYYVCDKCEAVVKKCEHCTRKHVPTM